MFQGESAFTSGRHGEHWTAFRVPVSDSRPRWLLEGMLDAYGVVAGVASPVQRYGKALGGASMRVAVVMCDCLLRVNFVRVRASSDSRRD
jgi:hypothetical protein